MTLSANNTHAFGLAQQQHVSKLDLWPQQWSLQVLQFVVFDFYGWIHEQWRIWSTRHISYKTVNYIEQILFYSIFLIMLVILKSELRIDISDALLCLQFVHIQLFCDYVTEYNTESVVCSRAKHHTPTHSYNCGRS